MYIWIGKKPLTPYSKVLEGLLGREVTRISCGPGHTAALTLHGDVYTWGAGAGGRVRVATRHCYIFKVPAFTQLCISDVNEFQRKNEI